MYGLSGFHTTSGCPNLVKSSTPLFRSNKSIIVLTNAVQRRVDYCWSLDAAREVTCIEIISLQQQQPVAPLGAQVVDMKNEASSGAGWTIGENGLPKLPVNSVLIVVGVGCIILETVSHAPILGAFMPRVLQVSA